MQSKLDATAKLVACAIAAHMNRHGKAWPAKKTLADFSSLKSLRAVDRAVKRLETSGLLRIEKQSFGGKANLYQGHCNPVPRDGVQRASNPVPEGRGFQRGRKHGQPRTQSPTNPVPRDARSKEGRQDLLQDQPRSTAAETPWPPALRRRREQRADRRGPRLRAHDGA